MGKQYKKEPNFEILNFKLLTLYLRGHFHDTKGQKWDLSTRTRGSRVRVSLLWWTWGSPLIRWTQKGARSGLSTPALFFPAPFAGLLRAADIDFSTLHLRLLTITHPLNAYFGQSIHQLLIHQLLILSWHYTWNWGNRNKHGRIFHSQRTYSLVARDRKIIRFISSEHGDPGF